MTQRIIGQYAAEALSTPVPGPDVAELRAEVLARVTPQAELAALVHEYVASVQPQAEVAQAVAELLTTVQPSAEVAHLLLEALTTRDPSLRAEAIQVSGLLVEMLRNNASAGASVQRDVFAFRHNWAEPLVERLEWQTRVARTTSGQERREANRSHPRRSLTYRVGSGRTFDALVADWLSEHLGKPAWWPLPQYAAHLSRAAVAGASVLQAPGINARHFGPPSAQLLLDAAGVQGWGGPERYALLIGAHGWRVLRIQSIVGDTVHLAELLPGDAAAGSSLMPLLWGRASEAVNFTQLLPGVAAGSVTALLDPAPEPEGQPADALLDGIPVWPDGNWSSDPGATVAASVTQHDLSPAQPWLRRDDPWTLSTLQRRYLATSSAAIEAWRERLWRAQGRLNAFWVPDGLAPVLRLTQPYQPEDGWLSVDASQASDLWRRPAACVVLLPDGTQRHVLTGPLETDADGTLMLRSTLNVHIPAGSRVIRLMRCRLDHDAVDLHWHAPQLVEIALTLRQLPEAHSVAAIDWPRLIAPPAQSLPMVLSAPPRPPQFQCPPLPRPRIRYAQVNNDFWAFIVPQGVHTVWVWGCGAGGLEGFSFGIDVHPVGDFAHGGAGGSSGYYNTAPIPVQVTPGELIQVKQARSPWFANNPNISTFAPDGEASTFGHYLTFPGGKGGGHATRDRPGQPQPIPYFAGLTANPGQPGEIGSLLKGGDGGNGGETPFSVSAPFWGSPFTVQFNPQRPPLPDGHFFGNLGSLGGGPNTMQRAGVPVFDMPGGGIGGHGGQLRRLGGAYQPVAALPGLAVHGDARSSRGMIVVEWDDPTPPPGQPL